MYKRSATSSPQDLFNSTIQQVGPKKYEDLVSDTSWFNVFYRDVSSRIDESLLESIYSANVGRPNAPLRVLVGMIILKEGQDWTDEQMYENCRFNLTVMRALGLTNINDEVPVLSTYYDFKARLHQNWEATGVNLFAKLFRSITTSQVKKYKLGGKQIRMDSKLIQTNIGRWTRMQKVLQAFQVFYKTLETRSTDQIRKQADKEYIEEIMSKTITNHLYGMTKKQEADWLRRLGYLIRKVLNIYTEDDSPKYVQLKRMYEEQYEVKEVDREEEGPKDSGDHPQDPEVTPKAAKDIGSNSMQSIHDTDAAYRIKGHGSHQQKVCGYSSNITELVGEEINLITDVQLEKATHSDDAYLLPAIMNTEHVTGDSVESLHTDGAYDSHKNRLALGEREIKKWHLSKLKGGGFYKFRINEQGEVEVYDEKSHIWIKATLRENGKYMIEVEGRKMKYRYFTKERINSYLSLQKIRPKEIEKGIRANVESTINQVFHTLKGQRSKYRGQMEHAIFAVSRCLWVNCFRIAQFGNKQVQLAIVN